MGWPAYNLVSRSFDIYRRRHYYSPHSPVVESPQPQSPSPLRISHPIYQTLGVDVQRYNWEGPPPASVRWWCTTNYCRTGQRREIFRSTSLSALRVSRYPPDICMRRVSLLQTACKRWATSGSPHVGATGVVRSHRGLSLSSYVDRTSRTRSGTSSRSWRERVRPLWQDTRNLPQGLYSSRYHLHSTPDRPT